jgi:4-amino-4-deoxy-L-arabinose transferase-like glycosyltransferase
LPFPAFLRRRPLLALLALALLLGLAFQGTRGLWEPDEGRYTNVALQMLHSGDFISLRRNEEALHFTKPPVTYWTIAASVATFGRTEFAVRLPIALAFALTVVLVFQLGKRFVPDKPWLPALIYATSPVPFFAANTINTDSMLALMETLAVLCYAQYRFGSGNARWLDAMWAGFGLAFLTKGPPSLLPLLAIVAFELSLRFGANPASAAMEAGAPARGSLSRLMLRPLGLLAFALIGLGWYWVVIRRHPGLLDYFLGHEVYARIATAELDRFPQWYGPLAVYLPTLTLGALPWLALALPKLRKPAWLAAPMELRFLWLWFALPLLVFCLARSRLPLYVLPLFAPLSLLLGRALTGLRWRPAGIALLVLWLALMLGIQYAAGAMYPTDKDGRVFARQLLPMLPGKPGELLFVEDMTRNGLNLYLDTHIERLSFKPMPKMLSDSSYDQTLAEELAGPDRERVFIMKTEVERYFLDALREAGKTPVKLGNIEDIKGRAARNRVVYTIEGDFPAR